MAYFVFKDSSTPVKASNLNPLNPTYLRCIADQTRSKNDQPTLYHRPLHCTPAQHTTCGERDHSRPFSIGWKTYPAHCDLSERADQPPLYFRPAYALPDLLPLIADPSIFPERERAGVDRLSGVNGALNRFKLINYIDYMRISGTGPS